MFNKLFTLSLSAFIVLIFCSMSFSQTTVFSDNFDSYNVGQGVAMNNNVDWDTWSGGGGGGEDCLVSDAFSNSPSNSFVVVANNDLIYRFGRLNSGKWSVSMQVYIPAGNSGYFNLMSAFDLGTFHWNMEIYFDVGGTGRHLTGDPDVAFSWTEDTWMEVEVIVDLDNDLAEIWLDGAKLNSWTYTNSTSTGTSDLVLSVNDFFGAAATELMYVDDYLVVELPVGPPGTTVFSDNFDSYNVGQGVAMNNNVDWDTWSGGGGGGEDCLVSDAFSNSPSNSFVVVANNDLIHRFGRLNSGMYSISMQVYIPAGNSGYFNLMSAFDLGTFHWNMEIYFDVGGTGRHLTGDPDVAFSWTEDTWMEVEVIVDLDNDLAEIWLDGAMLNSWTYTNSTSTGTSDLVLSVNDFFGAAATELMYVDDYRVADLTVTAVEDDEVLGPLTFGLEQNYPNPFNPSTNIKYRVSESGSVKLSIYSILGEEVAVLVDGLVQAGSYEVTFDASNLPSGAYIYRLQTGNTVQAKKMLLMK